MCKEQKSDAERHKPRVRPSETNLSYLNGLVIVRRRGLVGPQAVATIVSLVPRSKTG